jgi:hypothetical protein
VLSTVTEAAVKDKFFPVTREDVKTLIERLLICKATAVFERKVEVPLMVMLAQATEVASDNVTKAPSMTWKYGILSDCPPRV